jgi:two-component system LytT family response regulator
MISLKTEGHVSIVRVNTIKYVLIDGDQSQVFLADGDRMMVTKRQDDWQRQLPEKYFLRVNQSACINLNFVDRVEFNPGSVAKVYLKGVLEPLVCGAEYAAQVRDFNA